MTVSFSDTELVEMVARAEKIGVSFYECLAGAARSKDARDLFARIVREEKEHVRELEGLVGHQAAETYPDEYYAYLRALVEGRAFGDDQSCQRMAKNTRDESEALRIASDFEKEVILFLHEMRRFLPEGKQETVDRLLRGEHEHIAHLHALGQR